MYGLTDLQLQILHTYCRQLRVELRRYERRRRRKSFSLFGITSFLIVKILCVVSMQAENPWQIITPMYGTSIHVYRATLVRITVLVHYRLFKFNLKKGTTKYQFGNNI